MLADPIVLQTKGLSKTYRQRSGFLGTQVNVVNALKDVSITLKSGKTLAVVGESGSGKSTLARCLLQLQPADSGEVWFAAEDRQPLVNLANLSELDLRKARRHLQMIFQDPFASLNPRMRVADIVAEGLRIHKIGSQSQQAEKVVEMLERVGLQADDRQKYPHAFSGGQRQRIGIARALILQPRVVVCDEPVSALDVSVQAQILQLLKDLQSEMGLSYVFITHDLRVVRHIADDVLVMRQGQVVESGSVEAIYQQPQMEYTKDLLASIPGQRVVSESLQA